MNEGNAKTLTRVKATPNVQGQFFFFRVSKRVLIPILLLRTHREQPATELNCTNNMHSLKTGEPKLGASLAVHH